MVGRGELQLPRKYAFTFNCCIANGLMPPNLPHNVPLGLINLWLYGRTFLEPGPWKQCGNSSHLKKYQI
jgi:hypothetical protein